MAIGAALTSLAFLALYLARTCPDLALVGDSAELVTAAALWGVPHPPGYPLYTAIGHLFAAVPFGTVPWRVHVTSAVFHAGAVAATMAAAFALTKSRAAAFAAGIGLGLSRSFLLGSLYAEVFPLNDLLYALTIALALMARRAPREAAGRVLHALAISPGVAAGHHMMFALAGPAVAVLAWRPTASLVRESPRRGLTLAAAFLASVAVAYVLIPLAAERSPYLSWGDVHDWPSFARLVTRADYEGLFSPSSHATSGHGWLRVAAWTHLVARSMGLSMLFAALLGVVVCLRGDRVAGIGLLLAVAVPGPVFAWLNALDTSSEGTLAYFERFTTMSHVAVAVAFGAGVGAARSAISRRPGATAAATAVLFAWASARFVSTSDVDMHDDRRGIAFAHDLLLRAPDRSLVLLSGDQPIDAELYLCGVERVCGDRIAFAPGMLSLPWKMAEIRRRHPDLDIPWTEGPALRRTHLLVAATHDRPVFLYPDLLEKDPLLASFETAPHSLLLRAAAPREDLLADDQGGRRSMSR